MKLSLGVVLLAAFATGCATSATHEEATTGAGSAIATSDLDAITGVWHLDRAQSTGIILEDQIEIIAQEVTDPEWAGTAVRIPAYDRPPFSQINQGEKCSSLEATEQDPGLRVCQTSHYGNNKLDQKIVATEIHLDGSEHGSQTTLQSITRFQGNAIRYTYTIDGEVSTDAVYKR